MVFDGQPSKETDYLDVTSILREQRVCWNSAVIYPILYKK